MISQRTIDRVRELVSLVDLFGEYNERRIRKSGPRHAGWCPLCRPENPKSDALTIYPDNTFHCYRCRAHGDLFEAYMLLAQVDDFQVAVEHLAKRAGVEVERIEKNPARAEAAQVERSRRAAAYVAAEWATTWMAQQLAAQPHAEVLGYLLVDRKLPREVVEKRRLGWSPGDQIIPAAAAAGHSIEALMAAGLVVERDGLRRSFFYERITIPIVDPNGRVIAWTARALPSAMKEAAERGTSIGKYINNAETLIYRKDRVLLGLREARVAAKPLGGLVVVEGALDVLAFDALQLGGAVCTCGLGMSEDQANALAAVAESAEVPVVLLYDGDSAGQAAISRNAELLFRIGARARIAMLPAEVVNAHGDKRRPKDAADVWEHAGLSGAAIIKASLEAGQHALPYLLNKAAPAPGSLDIDQRLAAADKLLAPINQIIDDERRDLAIDQVAEHLALTRAQLARRSDRQRQDSAAVAPAATQSQAGGSPPKGDWGFHIPPADTLGPKAPDPSQPFELNDLGNALRFAARYGTRVRYVATWGSWIIWCGTHWRIDDNGAAQAWMLEAIDSSCRDEQTAAWDASRRAPKNSRDAELWASRAVELERWRVKNLSARSKGNSLDVAQQLRCLVVTSGDLDTDPYLFAVKNGWIDLRTKTLHDHDPLKLYTRCCPVAYNPKAVDARWEKFLLDCTGWTAADSDLLRSQAMDLLGFLQRFAGYCATGDTGEQAVLMMAGPGGNGKSLYSSCIQSILGGYAYSADFAIFLASHGDKRKWTLANLEKTRLVVCEESGEGKRFSSDLVKSVTGGTPIEAEAKGRQPFTYLPKFKVWFVTNHPPRVSDQDDGFWRRMRLVRFDYVPPKRDRHLATHLLQTQVAQEAILAWIVDGAAAWHTGGLAEPAQVLHANQAYRAEQDPLADWLTERTIWGPEETVSKAGLRKDYLDWCKGQGVDPISARNLCDRLRRLGAVDDNVFALNADTQRSERGWQGLRLRIDGMDDKLVGGPPKPPPQLPDDGNTSTDNTSAATPKSRFDAPGSPSAGASPEAGSIGNKVLPQSTCGESVAAQPVDTADGYDQSQHDYTSPATSSHGAPAPAPDHAPERTGERVRASRADIPSVAAAAEEREGVPLGEDQHPTGRAAKLRRPPSPDEDLFADQPPAQPPMREPGADEDEPPWDPSWGTAGPPPDSPI